MIIQVMIDQLIQYIDVNDDNFGLGGAFTQQGATVDLTSKTSVIEGYFILFVIRLQNPRICHQQINKTCVIEGSLIIHPFCHLFPKSYSATFLSSKVVLSFITLITIVNDNQYQKPKSKSVSS